MGSGDGIGAQSTFGGSSRAHDRAAHYRPLHAADRMTSCDTPPLPCTRFPSTMPCMLATLLLLACSLPQQPLVVPAFAAYAAPDPDAMARADDGSVPTWHGDLTWHGSLDRAGELRATVRLLPNAPPAVLQLRIGEVARTAELAANATSVTFAGVAVPAGSVALRLTSSSDRPPGLDALELSGTAANGAHFADIERRNCASIHLGYELPESLAAGSAWFYCECTPRTDPLWTYYMATGWRRGYFGMQVNSEHERRVIFSVWDSGNEATDRAKVHADDRVALLASGDRVHADSFGNEGTGGHSHVVQDWVLGDTFCFLVHAAARATDTTYTGWYATEPGGAWRLVASFRAPKDGNLLRGLYSFDENFSGQNGDLRRECEFGNQWVRGDDGPWQPLVRAHFSHDGHGKAVRRDRWGAVRGDRLVLTTGGFELPPADAVVEAGGRLERTAGAGAPPRKLPPLPPDPATPASDR